MTVCNMTAGFRLNCGASLDRRGAVGPTSGHLFIDLSVVMWGGVGKRINVGELLICNYDIAVGIYLVF